MCFDMYVPNLVFDIPFLLEQIWIRLKKDDPTKISVTEVYDALVRNPKGNPPIEELFVLFPNNCTKVENGQRIPSVTLWVVTPDSYGIMNEEGRDYEWAFEEPKWLDKKQTLISRSYCVVPPDPRGPSFVEFPGKVIDGVVEFPDTLNADLQSVLSDKSVLKTLVSIKLQEPLLPGEEGWLRLKVVPFMLDQSCPRQRIMGEADAIHFSQRLTATCPILVRDRLRAQLDRKHPSYTSEKINRHHRLRSIIFTEGIYASGTAVRINDHRIAIIGCEEVDISEASCTEAALYYGTIPLLEQTSQTGLWWGCGSERNMDYDLIHNAERVLNMLKYSGSPLLTKEVARDLSPSTKHEAFCTILEEMVKAKLLQKNGNEEKIYLADDLADHEEERLAKLRQVYAVASIEDELLSSNFSDLHPFRIDYCASWYTKK